MAEVKALPPGKSGGTRLRTLDPSRATPPVRPEKTRALDRPGMTFPELEEYTVWWETKRGKTPREIAKKWGLAITQVRAIQRKRPENVKIPLAQMDLQMRQIFAQLTSLQTDILSEIDRRDFEGVSIAQKMVALGVVSDKVRDILKDARAAETDPGHLRGTTNVFVSLEERQQAEERIREKLKRTGLAVEVQEAEVIEEAEEATEEEETKNEDQLSLFEGTHENSRFEEVAPESRWDQMFEKNKFEELVPGVMREVDRELKRPEIETRKSRKARHRRKSKELTELKGKMK